MEQKYKTVSSFRQIEITVKKSRFIGSCSPADSQEAAMDFLNRIRSQFPDAGHHAYAYIIDTYQIRYNDGGEPQKTAGLPILNVIQSTGLVKTMIAVTRYFGGILLGTGGLARAYGQAAQQAVQASRIVEKIPRQKISVVTDYNTGQRIAKHEKNNGLYDLIHTGYGENVEHIMLVDLDKTKLFIQKMKDESKGRAVINKLGVEYMDSESRLPPHD